MSLFLACTLLSLTRAWELNRKLGDGSKYMSGTLSAVSVFSAGDESEAEKEITTYIKEDDDDKVSLYASFGAYNSYDNSIHAGTEVFLDSVEGNGIVLNEMIKSPDSDKLSVVFGNNRKVYFADEAGVHHNEEDMGLDESGMNDMFELVTANADKSLVAFTSGKTIVLVKGPNNIQTFTVGEQLLDICIASNSVLAVASDILYVVDIEGAHVSKQEWTGILSVSYRDGKVIVIEKITSDGGEQIVSRNCTMNGLNLSCDADAVGIVPYDENMKDCIGELGSGIGAPVASASDSYSTLVLVPLCQKLETNKELSLTINGYKLFSLTADSGSTQEDQLDVTHTLWSTSEQEEPSLLFFHSISMTTGVAVVNGPTYYKLGTANATPTMTFDERVLVMARGCSRSTYNYPHCTKRPWAAQYEDDTLPASCPIEYDGYYCDRCAPRFKEHKSDAGDQVECYGCNGLFYGPRCAASTIGTLLLFLVFAGLMCGVVVGYIKNRD